MGLHVEEWDGYVSLRRSAPMGRRVLVALAMWAAAAIVLAKELKTFYSQEFSLEFDFNFI